MALTSTTVLRQAWGVPRATLTPAALTCHPKPKKPLIIKLKNQKAPNDSALYVRKQRQPQHPPEQPGPPVPGTGCTPGPGSVSSIRAPAPAFRFQEEPFRAGTGAGGWDRTVLPAVGPPAPGGAALAHGGDFPLFTARARSAMSLG